MGNKGFNLIDEALCGDKIHACGKTEQSVKNELKKKKAKHMRRCNKCKRIANPPSYVYLTP